MSIGWTDVSTIGTHAGDGVSGAGGSVDAGIDVKVSAGEIAAGGGATASGIAESSVCVDVGRPLAGAVSSGGG